MLPLTFDPYFDAVLRDHVVRAARKSGIPLPVLERALESTTAALDFLTSCGRVVLEAYIDDASAAVDHVGWILVDKETGRAVLA